MGEFEDLLDQAESGNTEAVATLREKFGESTLRDQAGEAGALRKQREEDAPLLREAKLARFQKELGDDLGVDITIEDLGTVDPSEITKEFVESTAKVKLEKQTQARTTAAREAGFDNVEDYNKAMTTLKKEQDTKLAAMQAIGGATSSASGAPPGSEPTVTPFEAGKKTFEEAKDLGQTDDEALAEAAHSIMAIQAPVPIDE